MQSEEEKKKETISDGIIIVSRAHPPLLAIVLQC